MILLDTNPHPEINAVRMSSITLPSCIEFGEIQNIKKQLAELELSQATVSGEIAKETRSCKIAWIPYTDEWSWLYGRVYDLALWANGEAFKFEPLDFTEPIMYCEWESGDHFDWHVDIGDIHPYSSRKLAVTVQLSDSDDYRGGNLEFASSPNPEYWYTVSRAAGSVVIYPTYLTHRITPVTSGVRKSLVFWLGGIPFS
jgi:PKHD-type hydroxylase